MVYAQAKILENETHKILWDFEMEIDHLIPTRISDLVIINKNKKEPADHRLKIKENEEIQVLKSC